MDYFCTNSFLYKRLKDSLSPFSLHQVVQSATHVSPSCTSSLIDLALMSNISQLSSCSVVPPLENSDHHGLHLVITQLSVPTQKPRKPRLIWKYAQADFDSARAMIETTDWDSLISEDVNVSLAKWQARFMWIMEQCIPRSSPPDKHNLPWLSKKITQSIRRKNNLYKRARRFSSDKSWQKYRRMRNKVTSMLRGVKRMYTQ